MNHDREKDHQIQNLALLGQLAGGIAHDFNNLLTAMFFNLETARAEVRASSEASRAFHNLEALMKRAATTTRQLLTFARQRTLDARPLDVNVEIGRSLDVLDRLMGESIEVYFLPSQENLWMLADASMIDQALLNLCFNARDAMPGGGVVLVEAKPHSHTADSALRCPEAAPGDYVEIRFTDSGIGIPPENLSRVFEPFFTTKEPGKGTGLGLASVYGGARQHGGWVEVESTVGKGTTFSLFLPRTTEPPAWAASAPAPALFSLRGTILIVEDEIAICKTMTTLLERAGHLVLQASNGKEAWAFLENQEIPVDLLITDWMIPGALKGLELATRVKAERPSLPVILMSGWADEAGRSNSDRREGILLLHKPFRFETLLNLIEGCLNRGAATDSGEVL
jgi:CheY-like chemotaxis protein